MKFTFLGFSQQKALEFNLDDKDLAILRYFIDFKDSGAMKVEIIDNKPYYWIKYETLLKELPILGIKSKDVLRRRFKNLVSAEVLEFKLIKQGGTFSFYTVGKKYLELITNTENNSEKEQQPFSEKQPTQKSDPTYSKVGPGPTQKSEQNINLLKDPSTKDIDNIAVEIIEYLNKKANTRYNPKTKITQKLIKARIEDGFILTDFKKVINNKTTEWLNTEFEKFLRPSTLFRDSKFEEYLNQKTNLEKERKVTENMNGNIYQDFKFDD